MTARPSPGRRRRVLLLAALVGAFCVAVELLCRALFPDRPPIRFEQDVQVLMGAGQGEFAEVLEADDELFWRLRPDVLLPVQSGRYGGRVSNGQRLREDHEIAVPKPAGELRVLCLGASPTYGTGVLLEECFVEVAERELAAAFPGERIELVNAGVPGYSLFQGLRLLETEGWRYEPDLVVLEFGSSGIQVWDDRGDVQYHEELRRRRPPGPLRWSRFFRLLWERRARHEPGPQRPRLSATEFRQLLVEAKQATRRRGAGLLLLAWPSRTHVLRTGGERHTPLQDVLLRFGANQGLPTIDLLPVFEQLCREHSPQEVFLDAWHVTPLANAAVGRRLAAELAPLLRDRARPSAGPPDAGRSGY